MAVKKSTTNKRCQGTYTLHGEKGRCKNYAEPGSKYCAYHKVIHHRI